MPLKHLWNGKNSGVHNPEAQSKAKAPTNTTKEKTAVANGNPWSALQFIAERRIEEARSRGAFDNLPGKGALLNLKICAICRNTYAWPSEFCEMPAYLPLGVGTRKSVNQTICSTEHAGY